MKLIPDDIDPTEMNESDARKALVEYRTPKLDAFRVAVRSHKTSELLQFAMQPITVAELVCIAPPDPAVMPNDEDRAALIAAMLAVADEIDRRIPVPA